MQLSRFPAIIDRLLVPIDQGESNVACNANWAYMQGKNCAMEPQQCADYYSCQFPAFIKDLQARFAEPWKKASSGFSFLFVQLPSYVEDLPSTTFGGRNDSSLPMLRLAQAAALSLPRVGMATLIDHGYIEGHYGSIHPMDKYIQQAPPTTTCLAGRFLTECL